MAARHLRISIVATIAILIMLATPATALAYYYWDIGYQSVSLTRGCSASIDKFNPIVGGGDASSSAWVLIGYPGDGYQYLQIGYAEDTKETGEVPRYFWEWSNDQVTWHKTWGSLSGSSGSNVFKITDDSSNFYLQIDGSTKLTKPKSELWWDTSATLVEIGGETYYSTDRVVGTSANRCSIGSATYKNGSGNWVQSSMTKDVDLSTMGSTLVNGQRSWSIWDTRE